LQRELYFCIAAFVKAQNGPSCREKRYGKTLDAPLCGIAATLIVKEEGG
jgi:hypothetical protein